MKHKQWIWMTAIVVFCAASLGIGVVRCFVGLPRGLHGSYYRDMLPAGVPVFEAHAKSFALDDAKKQLHTNYSIRWEGALFLPESGQYEFSLGSDDGSILYIGEQTVVYNWAVQTFTTQTGSIFLKKGVVPFRVDFMQQSGAAAISVSWKLPGTEEFSPLPTAYLFPVLPTAQAFQRDRVITMLWNLLLACWAIVLVGALIWSVLHRKALYAAIVRSWIGEQIWRVWNGMNLRLTHLLFFIGGRFGRQHSPFLHKRPVVLSLHLVVIFTVSLLVLYNNLGERSVIGADEAIHTRVANTIANTGNWHHLEYRGEPYAQKPPLKIWLSALTFRFIGNSEFWVRFWDATFALATMYLIYFLGRRTLHPLAGLMGALILLLCENYLYIHCARTGVQDSAMIFFLTAALALFWTRERSPKHYYLAGLAMSCCSLTKGGMGVAALVIMTLFLLLSKQWHEFTRKELYVMAAISLLLPLCWFLPNMLWVRGYTEQAFTANILGRITGSRHSDFAGKPWYYYFVVVSRYFSPWVWLTPLAMIWGIARSFRQQFPRFLIVWIVVIFCGFSAARLKLDWYIDPVYPPLSLLLGCWLYEVCCWLRSGWRRDCPLLFLLAVCGICAVFLQAFFPIYRESSRPRERYPIQEFVTYLEHLPKESYQVVLFGVNAESDITDQEHYYFNRIRLNVMTVEKIEDLELMLERDTRQIFVIAAEATAAAHSLFQVREARYPLPVNGRGCNKVVFPFNNIPDEKFSLTQRRLQEEGS